MQVAINSINKNPKTSFGSGKLPKIKRFIDNQSTHLIFNAVSPIVPILTNSEFIGSLNNISSILKYKVIVDTVEALSCIVDKSLRPLSASTKCTNCWAYLADAVRSISKKSNK